MTAKAGKYEWCAILPDSIQALLKHILRHQSLVLCLALTLLLAFGHSLPSTVLFSSSERYLPFHILLEFMAIAVCLSVFSLAWSLRWQGNNNRRILLGAGFLAVCLIDLAHTLSYPGMPYFFSPNSTEKAINFWLAARYVMAIVLLVMVFMPKTHWHRFACYSVFTGALIITMIVWWAGLTLQDQFPRTFIEGEGLTPFKITAEYLVALLYAIAAVLLYQDGQRTQDPHQIIMASAAWIMGLSELYFTLYVDVSDIFNLLGHINKAIAYLLVFRAIFSSAVLAPYHQLDLERSWLRALLISIPDPVWLKNKDGVYLACNKSFEGLVGCKPAEVIGKTDYDLFTQSHADLFREHDQLALKEDQVNVNQEWVDTSNAGRRRFETSKTAVSLADGTVLGVLGMAHDITDQRAAAENMKVLTEDLAAQIKERSLAEVSLVAANELYDAVIRSMPVPLMVLNPTGKVLTWNEAAVNVFGYTESEFIGCLGREITAEDSVAIFDAALNNSEDSTMMSGIEIKCHRKNGNDFPALLYSSKVRSSKGATRAIIFAIEDVSARRNIEAQLRQSQKLEAIGQLTAGIAHDFNNTLAVVVGNLELLLEGRVPKGQERILMQNAVDASMRGAEMTQRMLAYSRKQPLSPSIVDVGQLIENSLLLLQRTLEESISIEANIPDQLWNIRVDASRLQDAVLNLVINARDAMPSGGQLTIKVENTTVSVDSNNPFFEVSQGKYVVLSITDTGIGMSPEVLEQALDPFFTTKPVGEGSGLGLSMVYGFIKQSGGYLTIDSTPNIGTTVSLYLPPTEEHPPAKVAEVPYDNQLGARQGESVLVVEDDPAVRDIIQQYLTILGYKIIEADNGESALTALRNNPGIDIILSDVVLPDGMRGPDIVKAAREIKPDLKVLYMSGYSASALSRQGELMEDVQLLTKPFRSADLARRLRAILDLSARL